MGFLEPGNATVNYIASLVLLGTEAKWSASTMPNLVIEVTTANANDRKADILTLSLNANALSDVVNILVDGGHSGESLSQRVAMMLGAAVEIAQRLQPHCFVVIPKRWVVGRSFSWLLKCRRLWKNCEVRFIKVNRWLCWAY